ncbi:MAG: HlyC/CorC family transporter [Candidatus Aureabacteria bacterium]|nr:HlyC/CorC family transporter [Candidatus Auribacterota bacterium]NLW94175.1 HlyC/CorC family transporter [Chlamydiota bacterium]HOE26944.1 hemolysin family protein [bacterium]HQM52402.1 hemolysin family protein [bacterium]
MILGGIAVILLCLLLQAFFAGSEMALISCNRLRIRHRAELGQRMARIVQRFLDEPRNLLATTLVGYNVTVVIGSCILNNMVSHVVPRNLENLVSIAIYWPFVLIVGQIIPMAYGRQYANTLCILCAAPLRAAYYALFPLVWTASTMGKGISMLFTRGRSKKNPFVTKEEIELLLKESHASGVLRREEKEMIEEIFRFGKTTVREAMVPLIEVTAAPESATVGDLLALLDEDGHSRIPIYRDRIDRITGVINATDLAGVPEEARAGEIARPPHVIPESASIETALADLQAAGRHIAIVVNEYGGAAGVLTMEDIVEEIVGEIDDEYDTEEPAGWRKGADSIVVDARMRVERFNALFQDRMPVGVAETVAGFVTHLFGRVPSPGDEVAYENLRFRVTEADRYRVKTVEVRGARVAR